MQKIIYLYFYQNVKHVDSKKISHNTYKTHSVCNILDCKGSVQYSGEELVIWATTNQQAVLLLRLRWLLGGNNLLLATACGKASPFLGGLKPIQNLP